MNLSQKEKSILRGISADDVIDELKEENHFEGVSESLSNMIFENPECQRLRNMSRPVFLDPDSAHPRKKIDMNTMKEIGMLSIAVDNALIKAIKEKVQMSCPAIEAKIKEMIQEKMKSQSRTYSRKRRRNKEASNANEMKKQDEIPEEEVTAEEVPASEGTSRSESLVEKTTIPEEKVASKKASRRKKKRCKKVAEQNSALDKDATNKKGEASAESISSENIDEQTGTPKNDEIDKKVEASKESTPFKNIIEMCTNPDIRPNIVSRSDERDVRLIDKGIKNCWSWDWLEKEIDGVDLRDIIRKLDKAGTAYCLICRQKLQYGNMGFTGLSIHIMSAKHVSNVKAMKDNVALPEKPETTAEEVTGKTVRGRRKKRSKKVVITPEVPRVLPKGRSSRVPESIPKRTRIPNSKYFSEDLVSYGN